MCYVIKALGKKELMTMNNRMTTLGIDPKFGLSNLMSSFKSSLMLSRAISSPWHMYKEDLMKLNLQTVSFAADAMRMLNGARLSVNGLYSIIGVDWLRAAGINFSSKTALGFANLEGLPLNNTMGPVNARPLQDVKLNHDEGN